MTDEELIERLRAKAELQPNRIEAAACLETEVADRLTALLAENARLRGALMRIEEGTIPRPLGEPWRTDLASSKLDRCVHGQWMYETCEGCIDAFIAEALGGQP